MTFDRKVDIQTFLNENRFYGYQWLIFALCFFIVRLDGFDTAAIGFIALSLINEWGVSNAGAGACAEGCSWHDCRHCAAGQAICSPRDPFGEPRGPG